MEWLVSHQKNVAKYSYSLGKKVKLTEDELLNLKIAALLHDIGKSKISNEVLCKSGRLTLEDIYTLRKHPQLGAKILEDGRYNKNIVEAVLCHHERIDGSGYYGLKGNEICLFSRIIAIADSFDAMISERPYRKPKTKYEALKEIKSNLGTQFDKKLGTIFIDLINEDYRKVLDISIS